VREHGKPAREWGIVRAFNMHGKGTGGNDVAAKKVLAIDDDPKILQLLKEYLEELGAEAILAEDPHAGILAAREHKPDLILLDLMMPGMSGEQVATALMVEPETADIPVVFLTALAEEEDMEQSPGAGYGILSKAASPDVLVAKLAEYLSEAKG